jgi:hypothetical protein
MILDNLNRNHGLILPELSLLGLTDDLYPKDVDYREVERAFYSYNSNEFNKAYDKFVSLITARRMLSQKEKQILYDQVNRIKKTCSLYFSSCNNQVERDDIETSDLYEEFDQKGCAGFSLGAFELGVIKDVLKPEIKKLQSQADRNTSPTKFDAYDRITMIDNTHKAFKLVNKALSERGVYRAVSKYNRSKKNLKLDSIALHVARPNDTHHYQTLGDLDTNPKTVSFHMDPKFNVMKAIMYLNEVTLHNGPFTTVPYSNRWYHPEFERIIACGNSVGNYLNTPSHRNVMSIFPPIMTKNVIMGRYFEDGSEMSNILLNNMHKYTSDEANCILFDPAQTIHRGGLCDQGERVNLQIIMR